MPGLCSSEGLLRITTPNEQAFYFSFIKISETFIDDLLGGPGLGPKNTSTFSEN